MTSPTGRGRHESGAINIGRRYDERVGRHEDFDAAYRRLLGVILATDMATYLGAMSDHERRRRIREQLEKTPLPPLPR